jgi:hypothetical protein
VREREVEKRGERKKEREREVEKRGERDKGFVSKRQTV